MKKTLFLIISFLLFNLNVYADSINKITMDIFVNDNGDAHVTEVWSVNIKSGTEGYKPYYNLGNSEIINFKVRDDENNNYTNVSPWNTNLTFNEKAYKSGINYINNGLELCWGISKYGKREYTLEYDITGFVSETQDKQMIYWTLIPHELSLRPKSVEITIKSNHYFNDDVPVWGYGNYGGTAYVYEGIIEMNSDGRLDSNEYMTILVEFPKGMFNTSNILEKEFDDYHDMAEQGAVHYKDGPSIFSIIFIFSVFIIFAVSSILLVLKSVRNKNFKKVISKGKFKKDLNYFRDIPCDKDIFYAFFIASSYNLNKKETDFLGTLILYWIKKDIVTIDKREVKKVFRKKEETALILNREKIEGSSNEEEKEMFEYMYSASKDGVLESKEFERYASNNYSKILNWFKKVEKTERNKCLEKELILKQGLSYIETNEIYEEAKKMAGLKKFFDDFSSLEDKSAIEVKLWDYYLMYAQIFGMAKKVADEFKKIYPDVLTDNTYNDIVFVYAFSNRAMIGATTARTKAQSYSAGGGGFSSGGGGFGSFGGGGGGGGFR